MNKDVTVALMKAVKHNPTSAAVIAKLTHSRQHRHDAPGTGVDVHALASMSMETSRRREDSRMAMDIFPDVKLAATTLIGLILSPIDGVTTEFKYDLMADIGLPSTAVQEVTTVIKEYLETDLDLRQMAHDIMERTILKDGAAPVLIMPESALDEFINNPGSLSTESANGEVSEAISFRNRLTVELNKIFGPDGTPRSMGILRNHRGGGANLFAAMESAFGAEETDYDPRIVYGYKSTGAKDSQPRFMLATESAKVNDSFNPIYSDNTTFIDNVNVLRLPLVAKKLRDISAAKVEKQSRLGYTKYDDKEVQPSVMQIGDNELRNKVFREPTPPTTGIFAKLTAPEYLKRRTIGKPFWKFLPTESVMVVFEPSDPRKRNHYIVIIDPDGNPVRVDSGHDSFNMLSKQFNGFADNSSVVTSTLGQLAQARLDGFGDGNTPMETMRQLNAFHRQLVDANLAAKLRASFGSGEINIGCNEEVYDAMFAREMSNRQTQLLLTPSSLINYFAFNIDERGIGRSLLDDSRNILSVRAMLLVAEVFNAVRNSISRTNVDIAFDKRDPDPMKSAEVIKAALLASRGSMLPWGTFDLGALAMHIQRAGLEITYSGDNKMMPNTHLTYTETNSQHQRPDETFRDDLKSLSLAGFNMTPDMLESTGNVEFAEAVKNNRAQLARRVAMMSNQFNAEFKILVRRFIMYNGDIMDRIAKIIRANVRAVIRHDLKSKKLSASTAAILASLKDTRDKKRVNAIIARYCEEVAKEYISSFECTLPAHVRSSFPDRVKEVEEKIAALEVVMKQTASPETLGHLIKDTSIIETWTKQVIADAARQWFAEAGIDVEVSRYLERPDVPNDLNIKGKGLLEYNAALISQIMAMAVGDKKISTEVNAVLENAGIVEGEGSDDSGSSSTDDSSSDDSGGESSDGLDEFNFDEPTEDDAATSEEPANSEPEAPVVSEDESAETPPTEDSTPPPEEESKEDTTEKKEDDEK